MALRQARYLRMSHSTKLRVSEQDRSPRLGPIIVAENIRKAYGGEDSTEVVALDGLNLEILSGEFLSIVGPSGCGKSTFLNMVAGLDAPDSGRLLLGGAEIRGPGPDRGMCFQEYALFPWMTVFENVEFGPRARNADRRLRKETVRYYIDMVGLSGFENRFPSQLSGGMKQRCALARMLANDPSFLLMDEPLAAVDSQTRVLLQTEIAKIWAAENEAGRRRTVLWITHSIEEAVFLSDRVAVMSRRPGRVIEIVDIPLQRPRNEVLHADAIAAELCERIWSLIRDQAKDAMMEA